MRQPTFSSYFLSCIKFVFFTKFAVFKMSQLCHLCIFPYLEKSSIFIKKRPGVNDVLFGKILAEKKVWQIDENFNVRPKLQFLTKTLIFDQNFNFWLKFQFLIKISISIFDQNLNFWPKFQFLTKISIFDQNFNFNFWPQFQLSTKI